jgi:hypothetical protein
LPRWIPWLVVCGLGWLFGGCRMLLGSGLAIALLGLFSNVLAMRFYGIG